MSDYSLVQRGVVTITNADGASPKKVNLASAIKLSSSFLLLQIEDNRRNPRISRFGQSIVTGDEPSPKDFTHGITIDDLTRTQHRTTFHITGGSFFGLGSTLSSATEIRFTWNDGLGAESIETETEIIEHRKLTVRGRLINEGGQDKVEISWTPVAALEATTEQIDVTFEVFDIENLGDDIKELLFRGQLILGHLGENVIQDSIVLDDGGNMVSYRKRIFDSRTNAEAAEADIPDADALATGELSRVKVIQSIEQANNDRDLMTQVVLLKLSPTPGVN